CFARTRARHPDGARRPRGHRPHSGRRAGRGGWRRWHRAVGGLMRPRIFVTQPVARSAIDRLRRVASVKVNPDSSRIIPKKALLAAGRTSAICFPPLPDRIDPDVLAPNPKLAAVASQSITPDNIDVAEATRRKIPVTVVPPIVAEATADLTFGLMLAAARRMV